MIPRVQAGRLAKNQGVARAWREPCNSVNSRIENPRVGGSIPSPATMQSPERPLARPFRFSETAGATLLCVHGHIQ